MRAYVPPTHAKTLGYHIRSAGMDSTDAEANQLRNAPRDVQERIVAEIYKIADNAKSGNERIHANIVAYMLENEIGDYERIIDEPESPPREWGEDDKAF